MICSNTASLGKRNSQHVNNITRSLAPPNCHLDPAPLTHPSDHHMQWHKTNPHWPVRPVKAPQCREKCPGRPFTAALTCTILNRPSRRVVKGLIKQPWCLWMQDKGKPGQSQVLGLNPETNGKEAGAITVRTGYFFLILTPQKQKKWRNLLQFGVESHRTDEIHSFLTMTHYFKI